MKICTKCGIEKPLKSFRPFQRKGINYRYNYCNACSTKMCKEKNPEAFSEKSKQRWITRCKNNPTSTLISSCDKKDRKTFSCTNDLDPEFVKDIITQDCVYCGSKDDLITLDRMDNNKPHNKDNVVPGCYRCNMLRGAMPYEAWLLLVPVVREAYEGGDFKDWKHKPKWVDPKIIKRDVQF